MQTAADRLKAARRARGYRTAKEFAEKHGIPQPTYAMHEKGSRGLKRETAVGYARLLDISLDWLLTGGGDGPESQSRELGVSPVEVVGFVQAGHWVAAMEWDIDQRYPVWVSEDLREHEAFGLEVRGPSMNEKYPDGSVVICIPLLNFWRELENGDDVVIQRFEHDLVETTVKELRITEEGAWLWPRSSHPAHQAPIPLPWPPVPGDTMNQQPVVIRAVVVAAYTVKVRR